MMVWKNEIRFSDVSWSQYYLSKFTTRSQKVQEGDVAQLVERVLSMHEVWGSIPYLSNLLQQSDFVLTFC